MDQPGIDTSQLWFYPIDYLQGDYLDQKEPVVTHFAMLDRMLSGGLQPGVWCVEAEPGAGKSAFGLQLALNEAYGGASVAYISLEMPAYQCWSRIASSYSNGDDAQALGIGKFKWSDVPAMGRATAKALTHDGDIQRWQVIDADDMFVRATKALMVKAPNLLITDVPEARNIDTLKFIVRTCAAGGTRFVVVDYMQQIQTEPGADVYKRVTDVSAALKDIANELKIPILVIVSMNRESLKGKEPNMHGGSGSAAIEYDAVGIITLQEDKEKRTSECREVTLKLQKNRYGSSGGAIVMNYYPAYNTFYEVRRSE